MWTRQTAILLAIAVVTFAVYWYIGPKETAYSYHVSQANNILHGHLDLRPEHSLNLSVLERVLYDGEDFCLPPGDEAKLPGIVEYERALAAGASEAEARDSLISADCTLYMQHSLGPALMMMPGVLIWGLELNQVLVSAVMGALTAVFVFAISRKLTEDIWTQVSLTVLMMFGTNFWWVASNGSVWMLSHTTAVFFLFAAIYFTVVRRNPVLAGVCLGAAFLSRPTVIVSGLFFVVMFADLWLKPGAWSGGIQTLARRINWRPLLHFAAGLAPLLIVAALLNYVRYDSPLEFGYSYVESAHQVGLSYQYRYGDLDYRYLGLHPPAIFGAMPVFQQSGAYVLPQWYALAIWVTTPAILLAFFTNIKKNRSLTYICIGILSLTCVFLMSRAIAGAWDTGWSDLDPPKNLELAPFLIMVGIAVGAGVHQRDRFTLACWAAIIPTAFVIFSFAFVGYAQFGYRYALDFLPFVWLLVAHAIGQKIKWYHVTLIALGVLVNLWGVLWIYQFQESETFGWQWVTF